MDFIEKRNEFNCNVAGILEDYSKYSKQIGIGKPKKKWISTRLGCFYVTVILS